MKDDIPRFGVWEARLRNKISQTHIQVLVWGPSLWHPIAEYGTKRRSICEFLGHQCGPTSVRVSEDHQMQADYAPLRDFEAEEVQAEEADLIVLCFPPDVREVLGAHYELEILLEKPARGQKAAIAVPSDMPSLVKSRMDEFPRKQIFEFTEEQFSSCEGIRQFIRERAESRRREIVVVEASGY